MSQEFGDFANKARKAAADSAEGLKEKLSSLATPEEIEKIKEAAGDLAEEAASFVKKHPLASVAGALAAGFFLGVLVSRGK